MQLGGCCQLQGKNSHKKGMQCCTENLASALVISTEPQLSLVCMEDTNLSANTLQLVMKMCDTNWKKRPFTFKVKVAPFEVLKHNFYLPISSLRWTFSGFKHLESVSPCNVHTPTGNHGNLLATKGIAKRLLKQHHHCYCQHPPGTKWLVNPDFSVSTRCTS